MHERRTYTCKELCTPDVFETLFDAYSKKLYRYSYFHLSSKEDAEDLLSAAFVKLWEYVNQHRNAEVRNVSAFLYRIVRNLVIDAYRVRKPAQSVEEMLEAGIELPEVKALSADTRAEVSLVLKKMHELSSDDRDILLLRFIEDMAPSDIAALYDITENNASVRIHRALAKLKEIANR